MASLAFLLDRSAIVALAFGGAAMALAGNLLLGRAATAEGKAGARLLLRSGYAVTWASVALFIIAGFVANR